MSRLQRQCELRHPQNPASYCYERARGNHRDRHARSGHCASTAGSARTSRRSTNGYLQKLLRSGQVRLDAQARGGQRPPRGRRRRCACRAARAHTRKGTPAARPRASPARPLEADREFIEPMILFEDERRARAQQAVRPSPCRAAPAPTGTSTASLAGMADRFGDRPRLVHRLDRDTTGVLLVAKQRDAAAKLGRIFQTRSAAKTYWALVQATCRSRAPGQDRGGADQRPAGPDGDRVRKSPPGEQKEGHARTHRTIRWSTALAQQGLVGVAEARAPAVSISCARAWR